MNKALHLYWSKYSAKIIRRIVILIILLIAYALSYLVLKSEIIDIIPINKQYVVVLEKVKDSLHFIHPLHQEKNYRFKKIDIINFDTDTISLDFPVLQEKEYIGLITKHGDSFLNDLSYVKKRATVTGEVLTYIFKKYDDKNYNYYDNTLIHFAIDLRENRILWKHTIKNIYHRLSLFHDNETVFRQYNKNKKYHLEAINPKTGSILWAKNELKNELEGHIFIDNYLIFSSRHCTYIFNKKTGSLKKYYNRSYNKITHYKDFLYCDSSLSNSWYKIILKYKLKDEAQKANILFTNKIYTGYMLGAYKRNLLYTRLLPLSGYRDKNKFPVLTSYNLKNFAVNWEHEFKEYKGLDILDKPSSSQLFIYSANHHPLYKIRDRYMPVLFWGKARWTDSNNFQRLAICIIDMQTGKLLFKSKPVEMHHPYFFDHDTLYIHKEGEYYLVAPLKGEKNISLLIFNPNANIDAIKNRKEIDILNSFFTDSFQILYRKNKDFSLVFPAKLPSRRS